MLPTRDDVTAARARLGQSVRHTPLVGSHWLSTAASAEVRLKLECWQVTRSFKIRGALNAARRLVEAARLRSSTHGGRAPVSLVTASAGNHGLALATAAAEAGLPCVVFTPAGAPRSKVDAIARTGADLRATARDYDEAERRALEWAAGGGATFISPYNHPDVIAGAGTVGLEILEDWPEVEVVLVPLGGGGLASGIATALGAAPRRIDVIGIEVEASPAFTRALAYGAITPIVAGATVADGLGGNLEPGSMTFEMVRDRVDSVVVVPEHDVRRAMRGLLVEERLVVEGAGAVAVAAVLGGRMDLAGRRTAVVVSGANVDVEKLTAD